MNQSEQYLTTKFAETDSEKQQVLNKVNNFDFSFILNSLGLYTYKVQIKLTLNTLFLWLYDEDGTERVSIEYNINTKKNVVHTYSVYETQLVKDTLLLMQKVKSQVKYLARMTKPELATLTLMSKISESIAIFNDKNDNSINITLDETKKQFTFKYLDSVAVYDVILHGKKITLELNHSNNFKGIKTIQNQVSHINKLLKL